MPNFAFCFSLSVKHPRHTFISLLKSSTLSVGYTVFLHLVTPYFILFVLNLCCLCGTDHVLFYFVIYIGLHISLLVLLLALCGIFFCRPQVYSNIVYILFFFSPSFDERWILNVKMNLLRFLKAINVCDQHTL